MIRVYCAIALAILIAYLYYVGWVNNPIENMHLLERV